MDWTNWLRILRWRALEEGDADGALLSEERRREATARTRAGLTSEEIDSGLLTAREEGFLEKRADWLEHEVIGWSGSLVRLMDRLTVAQGRWSWALAGWALALAAGYSVSGLGQETEFNLLALPLVAVLLWNGVVMLAALVWELKPAPKRGRQGGLTEWLEKRMTSTARDQGREDEALTGVTVDQRFALLAGPPAAERLYRRLRAWFHLAAAVLALGSAAGLYARGWSREYQAVWESTLLTDARQAQGFFAGLFGPAARVLNLEIPLAEVPAMHRTGGRAVAPAPALPWIHLYAGTLLLLVVLPRMGLAALTLYRGRSLMNKRMRSLSWRPYLIRTLRAVEGGHEKVTMLVHGTDATPAHLEVWSRGVRERFGALIDAEATQVPLGDEDEFVGTWTPANARVVIVFNLATTPEAEVQRRFVADVRQSLLARQRDAELMVLLDATSIGDRWPPEKVANREQLWTEMMQGLADEVIIAARRAGDASSPRLPA